MNKDSRAMDAEHLQELADALPAEVNWYNDPITPEIAEAIWQASRQSLEDVWPRVVSDAQLVGEEIALALQEYFEDDDIIDEILTKVMATIKFGQSLEGQEPVGYLIQWNSDGRERVLLRFTPIMEPWLSRHNPTITKLFTIPSAIEIRNWISVNDRLPEQDQQVWTWFGDMAFAIFTDGKFFGGGDFTDEEYTENVTHWMPLPKPPALIKPSGES